MGRRGPRPMPTKLRLLKGEQRPSRINRRQPVPALRRPACPRHLGPEARRVWRAHAAELHRLGLLTTLDVDTFATFCEAVAMHRRAAEHLGVGLLMRGYRDQLVKNPAFQIWRDTGLMMRAFAQEFGFSPSARSSIDVPGTDPNDELEWILSTPRPDRPS